MKNIPVYFYKKSAVQYIILCLMIFIAGAVMAWYANTDELLFGALFFMLVVVFLAARICTRTALKITLELNRILFDELDPERFLAELDSKAFRRDPEKQQPNLKLFRASAYRHMGRYKEAEAIYIEFIKQMPKTVRDDGVKLLYSTVYANLSLLYSAAEKFDTAEKAYNKAREQVKGMTLDENARKSLEYAYYALLANNGETAEAIDYYKRLSTESPMTINRVSGHFKLAEAYEAAGYTELAQEEYRIAAETGGKLYLAQQAREKLQII